MIFESDDEQDPVRSKELEVKCLDLHEQILLRPDTYIANIKKARLNSLLYVVENGKIVENKTEIERKGKKVLETVGPLVSEGFIRIIIEIISNCIDNVYRSKEFGITPKTIRINYDKKTGRFTTWNDGKPISHAIHKEQNKYNIELICSRLLTSTNYDDTEKRKTSGRNGYGMKLTNIFSSVFEVESYNPHAKEDDDKSGLGKKQLYKQKWENNMYVRRDPEISIMKNPPVLPKGSGYTVFKFTPDYKKFQMEGLEEDAIKVIEKYVYDTAMIVSKYNVKVFLNDKEIQIKKLSDYAKLYQEDESQEEEDDISSEEENEDSNSDEDSDNTKTTSKKPHQIIEFSTKNSKLVIIPFHKHLSVSFVNGILTSEGGIHEQIWSEAIFRPLVNKINGIREKKEGNGKMTKEEKEKEKEKKKKAKEKNYQVNIEQVKSHFAIFIDVEVSNPIFRGQNKTLLGGLGEGESIEPEIKKTQISKLMKWDAIQEIKNYIQLKEMAELKQKKVKFLGYSSANFVDNPKKRKKCILAGCEGKSARTYLVSGMKYGLINIDGERVCGHDYIGTFCFKGKVMNPQGKKMRSISKNKEIAGLIQSLGLEPGVDYTDSKNLAKLKYGRFMICTDADVDGFHITGLILNVFYVLFPSILKIQGFFALNRTPIIKIDHKSQHLVFFYNSQAQRYIKEHNIPKHAVNYFKGLGTYQKTDIKRDFGQKVAVIECDDESNEYFVNIFNPKRSGFRKKWISQYDPSGEMIFETDNTIETLNFTDFANVDLRELRRAVLMLAI
jgi:DNA topoisomerase-2